MKIKNLIIRVVLPALAVLLALFVLVLAGDDPTPLRVGSSPDEIWTFIHTGHVVGARSTKLGLAKWSRWQATATNISWETQYSWRSKRTLFTRNTIYDFGTNGPIDEIHSRWRFHWPFK